MNFKIGFNTQNKDTTALIDVASGVGVVAEPRRSLVQVQFAGPGYSYAYYNDRFDLQVGDLVYVEGAMEGLQGRVEEISYTFKIKLSDYKRVIGKVDTDVRGALFMAGSHFITFDPAALPYEKVRSWFKAPEDPEEEYISVSDGKGFLLEDLSGMGARPVIMERGQNYYLRNRVVYLSVEGIRGRAIVEGTESYELEFTYQNGEIRDLTCSCFCSYPCKHEVAAMLQLQDLLKTIRENYSGQWNDTFAAITKNALFAFALGGKGAGELILG